MEKCDFCNRQAVFDGKTKFGPWAFMCDKHRALYGVKDERFITRLGGESREVPEVWVDIRKDHDT